MSGSHTQTADQTLTFGVNVKGAKTITQHKLPSLSFLVLDTVSPLQLFSSLVGIRITQLLCLVFYQR